MAWNAMRARGGAGPGFLRPAATLAISSGQQAAGRGVAASSSGDKQSSPLQSVSVTGTAFGTSSGVQVIYRNRGYFIDL